MQIDFEFNIDLFISPAQWAADRHQDLTGYY